MGDVLTRMTAPLQRPKAEPTAPSTPPVLPPSLRPPDSSTRLARGSGSHRPSIPNQFRCQRRRAIAFAMCGRGRSTASASSTAEEQRGAVKVIGARSSSSSPAGFAPFIPAPACEITGRQDPPTAASPAWPRWRWGGRVCGCSPLGSVESGASFPHSSEGTVQAEGGQVAAEEKLLEEEEEAQMHKHLPKLQLEGPRKVVPLVCRGLERK